MTPAICKFSKAVIALALGFVVTSTYPTKSKADTRKIVPTPQFAAALGTDVKTFISKPGMKFRKQLSSKWCPRKTCEWYRAKKRGSVNSQITVYARHGKIFSMSLRFSSWTKRNAEKALAKVSQFTNPGEVPPYIAKSSKSVRGLFGREQYEAYWPVEGGLATMGAQCRTQKINGKRYTEPFRECLMTGFKYFACEGDGANCRPNQSQARNDLPFDGDPHAH